MAYPVPAFIPPYGAFVLPDPPVIPKLYWGALTQEERIRKLCQELHRICEYANQLGIAINLDHEIIKQLEDDFEKFKESGFDDYYKEQLLAWINEHFADLISAGVRQVYFGLTDDGYFCAYVPDSWSEITFDTGAVFGRSDYGRLILRFEADPAQGAIDNTYGANASFGNAQLSAANRRLAEVIAQLITDVETVTRRSDETYNAEFTNLDEVVSNGNF